LNPWKGTWMSRQQILSRLAGQGWSVIYSTGLFSTWDVKKDIWKNSRLLFKLDFENGVFVMSKPKFLLRSLKFALIDNCSLFIFALYVRYIAWMQGKKNILIHIFHPEFFPYIKYLKSSKVIYHIYDAYHLTPGWNSRLHNLEMELLDKSDKIIALSKKMVSYDKYKSKNSISIIPNAVDYDFFSKASSLECPDELKRISYPRIGYVGSVNSKLDLQLVAQICSNNPSWNWIFVGRITEPIERSTDLYYIDGLKKCLESHNIHFLGEKNHRELPAYMGHMDVNTMCYRTCENGWWTAISPLKLYEYLAVGKPVVSTNIDAVKDYQDVVCICDGIDEWVIEIANFLDSNQDCLCQRQSVAVQNTWNERVSKIESIYNSL